MKRARELDTVLVLAVAKASIHFMIAGREDGNLGHHVAFTKPSMVSTRALAPSPTFHEWSWVVYPLSGIFTFHAANGTPQWGSRRIDSECQKSDSDQTLKVHDWI